MFNLYFMKILKFNDGKTIFLFNNIYGNFYVLLPLKFIIIGRFSTFIKLHKYFIFKNKKTNLKY
jgi:hypothetical protein